MADESIVESDAPAGAMEGVFDDQLLFNSPLFDAPTAIRTFVKRDSRRMPFSKASIAASIVQAASHPEEYEGTRAESLAHGVALYLMKTLPGEEASADEVDDAVERVLIEMNHPETALAFARLRDRRARIRRLREGDTQPILRELAEARDPDGLHERTVARPLFVRSGEDTLTQWNRTRIVEALVLETGLSEGEAELIAIEVEEQIRAAHLKTLTASLIRELVGAKLIEHGQAEARERHRRLGVPFYDAESIIRGGGGVPADPESTSRVLAQRVKKEFALEHVFSPAVTDAHLRGDFHLGASHHVDRVGTISISLEYVKRFGMALSEDRHVRPARNVLELVAQMAGFHNALQRHVARQVTWRDVNILMAPFVRDMDREEIRQIGRVLVYEAAYREAVSGPTQARGEWQLRWCVPTELAECEAIGPRGEFTGLGYGDYLHAAQELALSVLEALEAFPAQFHGYAPPRVTVVLTQDTQRAPGGQAFLDAASSAAMAGLAEIVFEREPGAPTANGSEPWQCGPSEMHRVTLNLPRLAFRAPREGAFFGELERCATVAIQAHQEKRDFLESLLLARGLGPLALLAQERQGRPFLPLDRGYYTLGVTGLNECVAALTGYELHQDPGARALGTQILGFLDEVRDQHFRQHHLPCAIAACEDTVVAGRLTTLDLQDYRDAATKVLQHTPRLVEDRYLEGVRTNQVNTATPMERARQEGALHALLSEASCRVDMHDEDTSTEAITVFIRKVFDQTSLKRLAFDLKS